MSGSWRPQQSNQIKTRYQQQNQYTDASNQQPQQQQKTPQFRQQQSQPQYEEQQQEIVYEASNIEPEYLPQAEDEPMDGAGVTEYKTEENMVVTEEQNSTSNGDTVKKDKELHGVDGGKIRKKRKRTVGEKNLRLKKFVKPKNAVMCLNELSPGIVYNVEPNDNGVAKISVEVDGKKYIGTASSKQLAKQNAAEKALISFVKAPLSTDGEPAVEDNTPWAVLASFAMYKLFNNWIVDDAAPEQNNMETNYQPFVQIMPPPPPPQITTKETTMNLDSLELKKILSTHLGKSFQEMVPRVPNPAKIVPENAGIMHPMMILHQMRPGIQFVQSKIITEDKQPKFSVMTVIDEQTFIGEGRNVKAAKYEMAIKANKTIFNIDCTYNQPT